MVFEIAQSDAQKDQQLFDTHLNQEVLEVEESQLRKLSDEEKNAISDRMYCSRRKIGEPIINPILKYDDSIITAQVGNVCHIRFVTLG